MSSYEQTAKNFVSHYITKKDRILNFSNQKIKNENFDKIILTEFVGRSEDLQPEFEKLRKSIKNNGLLILTSINPFWGNFFGFSKAKTPLIYLWFLENLLQISNFEIVKSGYLVSHPFLTFLEKIPKLKRLLPFQYVIARPKKALKKTDYSISVIIPCHNEEGNIRDCIKQVPKMGKFTEIIISDDGSTDRTLEIAKSYQKRFKNLSVLSLKSNRGKVWAVKKGFDAAIGDILMVWDADRTVPAWELGKFFDLMATGQARYTHGTRLAYPMEKQAMRFANLIGNLFFGWVYSWILETRITDTLCGTKVIFKKDYQKIKMGTEPWGDFDLLFGAKRLGLTIEEVPIHYKARTAGLSKMKTFRYGFIVAKMAVKGLFIFKIIPLFKKFVKPASLLFVMLLAISLRFLGLVPNFPYHPDEGYTQQATHNLVVNIVSKGDFEPKNYKYGSLNFYINGLAYLPFLAFSYIYYILNGLLLNSQLYARSLTDIFLEIIDKNGFYIFLFQRSFTACFGAASIYLLYLIGKKLFNKNVGLIGALVLAVAPMHVRDSHYITTDIPFLFFVLLSFFCMVNLFQKSKLRWYILSGFFIGVSSTIRYYPIALLVLPFAWIYDLKKGKQWFLNIFLSLLFVLIGVFIGLPFLPFSEASRNIFRDEMENLNLLFYGTSVSAYATNLISFFISFGKTSFPDIASLNPGKFLPYHASFLYFTGFGALPTLASLIGIVIGFIKYPKQTLILFILPLMNFVYISFYMHAVHQRLSMPLLPFLSLFAGLFLFRLWVFISNFIQKKYKKLILAFILLLILSYPLSQSFIASYQCSQESVYTTAKKWIDKNVDPNIKLAYVSGLLFPAKNFTNHTVSFNPNREFLLEEIRGMGKDYAFLNPAYLVDYYEYSFNNDFFTPPPHLYQNSFILLALNEYKSRAILLDKIEKNKLCEGTEFYFYKLPQLLPESKNFQSGFYFNFENDLNYWTLQMFELESQRVKMLYNKHEGHTGKGSLEYRWEKIDYTAPKIVSKLISVKPGRNYTLSAWIKSDNILLEDQRDGFLRIDFYKTDKESVDLPGDKLAITPRTYGEPGWRKVQVNIKAPENMHFATISFQVTGSKGSGSFYIDDLEFYGPN